MYLWVLEGNVAARRFYRSQGGIERGRTEITKVYGRADNGHTAAVTVTLPDTDVRNWGFDVTPARLVSGFITERGLIAAAPFAVAQLLS